MEAAIHYSGDLHAQFGPHKGKVKPFSLDQAGDYLLLGRSDYFHGGVGFDFLEVHGIVSGAFRGIQDFSTYHVFVSKLSFGENISSGGFWSHRSYGILTGYFSRPIYSQWTDPGIGFVGFRFNNGAGVQYGWARVRMSKLTQNAFTVLDYAYADPGEPITAGQRSSNEQAPDVDSLGWLALGAAGLMAWRKSRSQAAG